MFCTMTPLPEPILGVRGNPVLAEHLGTQKVLEVVLEPPPCGLPATFWTPSTARTPTGTPFQRRKGVPTGGFQRRNPPSGTHSNFTEPRTGGNKPLHLNSSVQHNILVFQRRCPFNGARPLRAM